jgi:putative transposase
MARTRTWEISDDFWRLAELLIPQSPRVPEKTYKRKPGTGRKSLYSNRLYFEAIVYVLRTGL